MSISSVDRHPTDDALELYALGQLNDSKLEDLEEHLLMCGNCQDRLTEIDSYVGNMKNACREVAAHQVEPAAPSFFSRVIQMPTPVWAGACALLTLAAAIPAIQRTPAVGQETAVSLAATRGAEAESAAGAVRLNIDTAGLKPFPAYVVTLVDSSGRQIWFTQAQPESSKISLRVPLRLNAGTYWVRISGPNAEPVREFSLRLK